VIVALLVAAPVGRSVAAQGGRSRTAILRVTANVVSDCLLTVTPLDFGTYDPIVAHVSQPLDGATDVSLACTQGAIASIDMNEGQNAPRPASATGSRGMAGPGGKVLTYDLYRDAARASRIGAGAAGIAMAAAPSVAPRIISVYGRIGPNQDVPVGTYTDEVMVTVRF
jgi:spore coat protein U-like protein